MNIVLKINDFFKGTSTIVLLRHDLFSFSRIVLYFSSWSDYFYWNAGGFVKTSWNNSQQYCINIFDTTTHESDTRKENICKKSLALLGSVFRIFLCLRRLLGWMNSFHVLSTT